MAIRSASVNLSPAQIITSLLTLKEGDMKTSVRVNAESGKATPWTFLNRMRFYYLDPATRENLEEIILNFSKGQLQESLLYEIRQSLPFEKKDLSTVKRRVEGMIYLTERLWMIALEAGKNAYGSDFSRQNLVGITRTMPMSHYHYVTGSREPINVLITRDDALQDPSAAFAKFDRDVNSLAEFIQETSARMQK